MEKQWKTIGVVGLGLIGGSLAKALKQNTDCEILGHDIDEATLRKAILVGAVDEPLTDDRLPDCDMVIVALYPQATVSYIESHAGRFRKDAIVMDCCGVKCSVCEHLEPVAAENGFCFIGGHPMAGLEHSGFTYAKKALFQNASMVLAPAKGTPIETVQRIKQLFLSLGFTNIQISTPEDHDRIIAFSSQLAHVVSSAYVKSPTALDHKGFSAGSYKDLTRVAKLNEEMWTELFLSNHEHLAGEIDGIITRLALYSQALREKDADALRKLLKEGRERKSLIDGERF